MRGVFVYIDGYNLYYSMKSSGLYEFLWLDIEKLVASYLSPNIHRIDCIKFFSSIWRKKPDRAKRHENFMRALQTVSGGKFKIIRGKFEETGMTECQYCHRVTSYQKEKWTDVNIALQILEDAINNMYDICTLVSADTDFTPALRLIKEKYNKEVRVLFPPGQFNDDLNRFADDSVMINKNQIVRCQLPPKIITDNGDSIEKPVEWMAGVPADEL